LTKKDKIITRRITVAQSKLVKEHKKLIAVHTKLVLKRKSVSKIERYIQSHPIGNKPVHYLHKMFKCTVVPPPPEMSGPIEGHGKNRIQNLIELIEKEKEQLVSIKRDATTLSQLIKYHKSLVNEAKNK